ncbi:MAG: Type IV pilus secretin PilQ [candidate division TM6 bacterium GW2011_GWF2_37_49]|nr:MAG: Type IV pilus secretin PilQ [candidate division TM6 bacterium GW2011_GWF2_37_49]
MVTLFLLVFCFSFVNYILPDSCVLPSEKYETMDIPPTTHDLIKQESDKKESETLHKIENVVKKVTNKNELKVESKSHKKNNFRLENKKIDSVYQASGAGSIWEALKNPLLEREIRKRLDEQHNDLAKIDKKVSLTLKKANIKTVFNQISKMTGVKILVDQDICVDVENIDLNDVSLLAVIKLIISSNNPPLAVVKDCDVWRITKLATAIDMFKFLSQQTLENDYLHESFTIANAKWEDSFKKRIESLWNGIVGEKDKSDKAKNYLVLEDNTHKILFKGRTDQVAIFKKFLKEIDVEVPQVKIDIRVILASKDFEDSIGFDWSGYYDRRLEVKRTDFVGMGAKESPSDSNPFQNAINWSMNFVPGLSYFKGSDAKIRLPFLFGNKNFDWNRWNIIINAAENKGEVKTVIKPTLLVNNEEWAEILVGQEMPHETKIAETVEGQPSNISTTQYKDIGIKIKIKSMVVPRNDAVFMDIFVENSHLRKSKFDFKTLPSQEKEGFNYMIETSRSKNRVLLKSGHTTLISGLISNSEEKVKTGVPFLQDLPGLGWLFQGNTKASFDKQLLIFITPTVV